MNMIFMGDVTITMADTFFSRFKGLLGKKSLEPGEGLLIRPCRQVHMFFMKFPIDVVFLDKNGIIVELVENLRPWQVSPYIKGAYQVLELPAGTIRTSLMKKGLKLNLDNTHV